MESTTPLSHTLSRFLVLSDAFGSAKVDFASMLASGFDYLMDAHVPPFRIVFIFRFSLCVGCFKFEFSDQGWRAL